MIPQPITAGLAQLGLQAELVAEGEGGTWLFRAGEFWVKAHRSPRKFAQEHTAYADVVPALAGAGFRAPVLQQADPTHRLLVLSHLPGSPATELTDRRDLHRQAGALLAALHALPCDDGDPLPLASALTLRAQRWLTKAAPHLPAPRLHQAREILTDTSSFAGEARRWCHRDLAPRNWLVHEGVLGLLDFEHARLDHPLIDLVKLADEEWAADPALQEAFFEGYGPLDAAARERLGWLLWSHGVATAAWGAEHGDEPTRRRGCALLDQLAARRSSAISSALA